MDFLRQHQLSIMLFLSGTCSVLAILSFFTKSMPRKRRIPLTFLELFAALLLFMDRYAYIYRGDVSETGWWMVRVANFCVYLFSLCLLMAFNLYLIDLFTHEGGLKTAPRRLRFAEILFVLGVVLLIISTFTGFYYDFDKYNRYHRASGFLLSYCFPFLIILIQFSVIIQYYKRIAKFIRIPLLLFAIIPTVATILQIFTYGLSLQNIAIVGEAVILYIFVVVDLNSTVENANKRELSLLKEEQKNMKIMFEQTATALANAIDAKDVYTHGHSRRVAEYAQRIAGIAGKDEKFCSDVYYAGLLHDVGKIGVPVSIITKEGKLSKQEFDEIKKHPVIGRQILSSISKSPYLSVAANYHHERYDGKGYPEGLKGDDIPEIARIIAVADSYDAMSSKRSYRAPLPQQKVREEIVKGMGTQFDPVFAKIMQQIIDADPDYVLKEHTELVELSGKTELVCEEFRSEKSEGYLLSEYPVKIHIHFNSDKNHLAPASIPSIILFDSLDARLHEDEHQKKDMLYYEYASIRFDGSIKAPGVRKSKTESLNTADYIPSDLLIEYKEGMDYEISAIKIKDHIVLTMKNRYKTWTFTLALPDNSRFSYLALTGEYCTLSNFEIHNESTPVSADSIERIAEEVNYIDGPEGDIPNLQIDGWCAAASKAIPLEDEMTLTFHSKSLPMARLIWHCPFIRLFYSDDQLYGGPNFEEFVLIRLDGENWESSEKCHNTILVNRLDDFKGWGSWKEQNRRGIDVTVHLKREANKITVNTQNAGIAIKSVSVLQSDFPKIYVSLTGDQCVLTNIRVK